MSFITVDMIKSLVSENMIRELITEGLIEKIFNDERVKSRIEKIVRKIVDSMRVDGMERGFSGSINGHEHEDNINDDDVETLREKLVELSERKLIQQVRKFLMDRRRCTERVLRKIMSEYEERRRNFAKFELARAFVCVIPSMMEKSGVFTFVDGAQNFSTKIIDDENTMFCIMHLMPVIEGGDYYFKYISAGIFLSSLCINQVRFVQKHSDDAQKHADDAQQPTDDAQEHSDDAQKPTDDALDRGSDLVH